MSFLFGQFSKDGEKYVEEKKLRVVLISPSPSPVLLPKNGESKQDPCYEASVQYDKVPSGVENVPPLHKLKEILLGYTAGLNCSVSSCIVLVFQPLSHLYFGFFAFMSMLLYVF